MIEPEKSYYIDQDKRFIDSLLSERYGPLQNIISEENQFKTFLNSYKIYGNHNDDDTDEYMVFNMYLNYIFTQKITESLEEPGEVHLYPVQDFDVISTSAKEWLIENQNKVKELYSDYLKKTNIDRKTNK